MIWGLGFRESKVARECLSPPELARIKSSFALERFYLEGIVLTHFLDFGFKKKEVMPRKVVVSYE